MATVCMLSSCTSYKTREFKQLNVVEFESWNAVVTLKAFSSSSGASWDDHSFGLLGEISRYPRKLESVYFAEVVQLEVFKDECGSPQSINVDSLVFKKFGEKQYGKSYAATTKGIIIDSKVEHICVRMGVNFFLKDSGKTTGRTFDIKMKRHEKTSVGPVLD